MDKLYTEIETRTDNGNYPGHFQKTNSLVNYVIYALMEDSCF